MGLLVDAPEGRRELEQMITPLWRLLDEEVAINSRSSRGRDVDRPVRG